MPDYASQGLSALWRNPITPRALRMGLACGIAAAVLKSLFHVNKEEDSVMFLNETEANWVKQIESASGAWSGFSTLLIFLMSFRVAQAYAIFNAALTVTDQMLHDWARAASNTASFCSKGVESLHSKHFLHTALRLFSILGASALEELSDVADHHLLGLEVLGAEDFDDHSLHILDCAASRSVESVFQLLQTYIANGIRSQMLDLPPPILSRIFGDLASGMDKYNCAMLQANRRFPLAYSQIMLSLLGAHFALLPFLMIFWKNGAAAAGVITFIQVFFLWAFQGLCEMFESPFEGNVDHIDPIWMQREFNRNLSLLVHHDMCKELRLKDAADLEYNALQSRVTLRQAALQREEWEHYEFPPESKKQTTCCRWFRCGCKSQLSAQIDRILVPGSQSDYQYGIIDREKTALHVIGIIDAEDDGDLIVALPCHGDEGTNLNVCSMPSGCKFRIKRIPLKSRHKLLVVAPTEWGTQDYTDFAGEHDFVPRDLLRHLTPKLLRHAPRASVLTQKQLKKHARVIPLKPSQALESSPISSSLKHDVGSVRSVMPKVSGGSFHLEDGDALSASSDTRRGSDLSSNLV